MRRINPNAERPDVSVVIPARNEEDTIAEVIRRLDACLEARGWTREIILGDSACTDGTVAAALRTGLPVRVVSDPEPGKGRILTRSLGKARGVVVAFIDADLDLQPEELPGLVDEVLSGATAAVGVKAGDALTARPWHRRVASRVVNAAARLILRTGLHDHQTGMKAFDGESLRRILPYVREVGWFWDTEVLWRLRRTGGSVAEVPVTLLNAVGSGLPLAGGIGGARQFMTLYGRMMLAPGYGREAQATAPALTAEDGTKGSWGDYRAS